MGTHLHQPDLTAKGSLLTASAASTLAEQTVGSDGQLLSADSTQTSGLKWVTNYKTGQTYAASNVTTDRTYDANATSLDELSDIVGTLIADLRSKGIVL